MNQASPRHRDGAIRTDAAYVMTQFPGLGRLTEAHWVTGRKGDDRVPGPSVYYLDGVVTLAPAMVSSLKTLPRSVPQRITDVLDADLAALAPAGTLVWPLELEQRTMQASPQYAVTLAVVEGTATAVLTASSDRPFPSPSTTP